MIGELSGLTEAQLRDVLQAVRRIAALDDVNAAAELDTLVWSISEMVTGSGKGRAVTFGSSAASLKVKHGSEKHGRRACRPRVS